MSEPDVVVHVAGIAFVPQAEADFDTAIRVNAGGAWNMANALFEVNSKARFLFISSSEVYGPAAAASLPISESLAPQPGNAYGVTKVMGEEASHFWGRRYPGQVLILRPFNHIGPGQDERFVVSNFAKQFAEIALGLRKPILRTGNLEARRDFTDVRDIVKGYVAACATGDGVVNLGSGKSVAIAELIRHLQELTGQNINVETDPAKVRVGEILDYYGSADRARELWHWQAEIPLRRSVEDAYNEWIAKLSA
jgi:GDP-4-dehydro-6-deoxy-D-mannose reductase